MMNVLRGKLAIAHLVFIIVNLFIAIDFWQVRSEADRVISIRQKLVYNSDQAWQDGRQLRTYEVRTGRQTFEISGQYRDLFKEDSFVSIYSTRFLDIVKSVKVEGNIVPIAFWLYIIFALTAIIISAVALSVHHNIDFRSFAAILSGILSIMVIYIIWL